jgi:predicted DNA binding protein
MNREVTIEKIENLQNILSQIKELVCEARELLEGTDEASYAKATWMAHIISALDNKHQFAYESSNMQNTINDLRESINCERSIVPTSNDLFIGEW